MALHLTLPVGRIPTFVHVLRRSGYLPLRAHVEQVDDGDAPYHLKMTATQAFPTGVIRVIYSPTEAPIEVGYDAVTDQVPAGK